jgi:hypothetical protein
MMARCRFAIRWRAGEMFERRLTSCVIAHLRLPSWLLQSIEPLSLRTYAVMDLTDGLSVPKNGVMCSTHCALRFISPLGLARLMGGIRLF